MSSYFINLDNQKKGFPNYGNSCFMATFLQIINRINFGETIDMNDCKNAYNNWNIEIYDILYKSYITKNPIPPEILEVKKYNKEKFKVQYYNFLKKKEKITKNEQDIQEMLINYINDNSNIIVPHPENPDQYIKLIPNLINIKTLKTYKCSICLHQTISHEDNSNLILTRQNLELLFSGKNISNSIKICNNCLSTKYKNIDYITNSRINDEKLKTYKNKIYDNTLEKLKGKTSAEQNKLIKNYRKKSIENVARTHRDRIIENELNKYNTPHIVEEKIVINSDGNIPKVLLLTSQNDIDYNLNIQKYDTPILNDNINIVIYDYNGNTPYFCRFQLKMIVCGPNSYIRIKSDMTSKSLIQLKKFINANKSNLYIFKDNDILVNDIIFKRLEPENDITNDDKLQFEEKIKYIISYIQENHMDKDISFKRYIFNEMLKQTLFISMNETGTPSSNAGHYFAVVRDNINDNSTNTWTKFNDNIIENNIYDPNTLEKYKNIARIYVYGLVE